MSNKKAGIRLSLKAIITIILAIILLVLFLLFIKTNIERGRIGMQEMIVAGAPPPQVEITSPKDGQIFEVGDEISFESRAYMLTRKSEMIGYFWDFNGDNSIDSRNKKEVFNIQTSNYYPFAEPGDYPITLKVINDLGGIGEASITIRIFTKNKKDPKKYLGEPVFFTPSEEGQNQETEIGNWRDILKIIPLTRWYDKEGDHEYDFSAIAKGKGGTIQSNDIKNKLDSLNKKHAVVLDTSPVITIPGYAIRNEDTTKERYFSYWKEYNSVVLVDYDNYTTALIASLFAAYYNSPLVFIGSSNYKAYETYLNGKKLYIIDGIDDEIWDYYSSKITDRTDYTSEELRNPSRKINRIIELRSSIDIND